MFAELDPRHHGENSGDTSVTPEPETTPPEPNLFQENDLVDSLQLVLPEALSLDDLEIDYGLDSSDVAELQKLKGHFEKATKIQILCGSFGLGDAILQIRYAVAVAKRLDKQVTCQVSAGLIPLLSPLTVQIPNLKFESRLLFESLNEPGTFTLKPDLGPFSIRDVKEAFTPPQEEFDREALLEHFFQLKDSYQTANDYQFTQPFLNAQPNEITHYLEDDSVIQSTDYKAGLIYNLLGIPISAAEIETQPLVNFPESELNTLAQDLELVLLPDAKEFETEARDRSVKSLPLPVWESFFAHLQTQQISEVGVVIGVNHPEYCLQVVELARQHGINVTTIQGDLLEVSRQLLRAKTIIGMDSGTTHLALDVQRWAKLHGRDIQLKSLFRQMGSSFYSGYGIVGAPTFMFDSSLETDLEAQQRLFAFTADN